MVGIYRSYGACPSPIGWERVAAGWVRVFNLWFYKDVAPDGAGGGSGGTGAEAQWLFLPEPDTRKTRLTRVAQQSWTPINPNRKESLRWR